MLILSTFLILLLITHLHSQSKQVNRIISIIFIYVLLLHLNNLNLNSNVYNNLIHLNQFSYTIINLILVLLVIYMLIISNHLTKLHIDNHWLGLFILINSFGLIILIIVNDLILLFIIIEIQSYSVYIITSIYNQSSQAIKAGLLYFIIGSLGSFIILDGTIGIYDNIGYTNLDYIYMYYHYINYTNLLYIIIGLFIKLSIGPYFNYTLIIYSNTPTIITTYISLYPKLSILSLIANILYYIPLDNLFIMTISIYIIIGILIGSIGGINEYKIKRLLGYSSLLNISYIIMLLISITNYNLIGFIVYLIQYATVHLLLFIIIMILPIYANITYVNNITNDYKSVNTIMVDKYSPIQSISSLYNLVIKNPMLGWYFIMGLFSLIGIPPLSGYYGKLITLISSLSSGYILLSIMLIIGSSISTYYYGYLIKLISFDYITIDTVANLNKSYTVLSLTNFISYLISILILIIIGISFIIYNIISGFYILGLY